MFIKLTVLQIWYQIFVAFHCNYYIVLFTVEIQSITAVNIFLTTFELTELCGIGYRKALEFLVKDYAISIHPEHKSQIESSQLARCIADFIDNEKIKTLAKASAWLGNDETHYIRKHQNHNIQDLKRFIKATVAYIDSEFSFTEAFEFLNNSQQ